jgi:hypothetical protein
MRAIALLAEVAQDMPDLAMLSWVITRSKAVADLRVLSGARTEGKTLVITPPPDVLSLVQHLYVAGWKRGGCCNDGGWDIYAYLRRDGAEVRVTGTTHIDPGHSSAIPYFATVPPFLDLGSGFKGAYSEWERKCREEEW